MLRGLRCAHGAQINFGDLTPILTYGQNYIKSIEVWRQEEINREERQYKKRADAKGNWYLKKAVVRRYGGLVVAMAKEAMMVDFNWSFE